MKEHRKTKLSDLELLIPIIAFVVLQYLFKKGMILAFHVSDTIGNGMASCLLLPIWIIWYICFFRKRKRVSDTETADKTRRDFTIPGALLLILAVITGICMISQKISTGSGWMLTGSLLAGPVNEEIVYRGLAYQKGKKRWNRYPVMGIVSLLFAVMHPGVYHMAAAFCFSLIACFIVDLTDSILPVLAGHILINILFM